MKYARFGNVGRVLEISQEKVYNLKKKQKTNKNHRILFRFTNANESNIIFSVLIAKQYESSKNSNFHFTQK